MQIATEDTEKEVALAKLAKRQGTNKNIVQKNNSLLYAGSPMYYYCKSCNHQMILPETHTCAAPTLCDECKELKAKGWIK